MVVGGWVVVTSGDVTGGEVAADAARSTRKGELGSGSCAFVLRMS